VFFFFERKTIYKALTLPLRGNPYSINKKCKLGPPHISLLFQALNALIIVWIGPLQRGHDTFFDLRSCCEHA